MIDISLHDLAKSLKGNLCNTSLTHITPNGVSIDTRDDLTNKVFVALKGIRDGHDFLPVAQEKSVVLAITEKPCDFAHILVRDTSKAIKDFAKFYKEHFHIQTIGITGSVGKTTTKDLTASIVSQKYKTVKTIGNFNNEIGLPLTIFRLEKETQVAVLEMGMNNLGEIHNLAEIAKPDIALITNIGTAHIENLGSRENILKAKSEILDFYPKKIILDGDDSYLQSLSNKVDADYYYLNRPLEKYSAYNIINKGLLGSTVTIKLDNIQFDLNIPIPGQYMIKNAIAGAIVGKYLGLTTEQIKIGIESFEPSANRMDIKQGPKNRIVINDTYNASPQSMKATIDMVTDQSGKKIAIFGDMYELGSFSEDLHKEVGEYENISKLDMLITIGPQSKFIHQSAFNIIDHNKTQCLHFENKQDFFDKFVQSDIIHELDNAIILIKASRAMGFEEISHKLIKNEEE